MTFKTGYNQKVQNFINNNKNGDYKKTKYKMIGEFKEILLETGKIYEELFPRIKSRVVEYLFFLTSTCGIWKIGAEALVEKIGCSISSVYNTVALLKKTGVFEVARIANNGAGKYIFVNKLHPNFTKIMEEVFNLSPSEIDELAISQLESRESNKNKGQFKGQPIPTKPSPTSDKQRFSGSYLFRSFFKQEKISIKDICVENVDKENGGIETFKSLEEQKEMLLMYGANTYQMKLLDMIHSFPYPQTIKDHGYKLVLRAGEQLDINSFYKAKDAVHELAMRVVDNQMTIRTLPGMFESIFKNSLVKKGSIGTNNLERELRTINKVPLYNWLAE